MMTLSWSFWRSTWEVWIYQLISFFHITVKVHKIPVPGLPMIPLATWKRKKIKTLWIAKEGKFIERLAFFWAISSNMIGKIPHVRQYTWSTVHLVVNCRTSETSNKWHITISLPVYPGKIAEWLRKTARNLNLGIGNFCTLRVVSKI